MKTDINCYAFLSKQQQKEILKQIKKNKKINFYAILHFYSLM
jgi:hypothetical protein